MQTAAGESTFPIMGGIVWDRTFLGDARHPDPASSTSCVGKVLYILVRLTLVTRRLLRRDGRCSAAATGPQAILALPAAMLTGLAFVDPDHRVLRDRRRTRHGVQQPLPLRRDPALPVLGHVLPDQPAAADPPAGRPTLTPLWHGVDLCRTLALGTADPGRRVAVHVAYLVGVAAARPLRAPTTRCSRRLRQ